MISVVPYLTFEGAAALAIELYTSAFPDGAVLHDERFEKESLRGQVRMARIRIGGQEIMLSDSGTTHDYSFTPASALYVECDDEEQLHALHEHLGHGGKDLMKPDNYGFSKLFVWFNDRLGVSWQLNVANEDDDDE